jgi:hypothetical protein
MKISCPFHTEQTPSCHVNIGKGFFHCFGCGTVGAAQRCGSGQIILTKQGGSPVKLVK